MTAEQYRDYLMLQVVRAGESARQSKLALEAAERSWAEALQEAKTAGCTDEDLAAVAGLAPERVQRITEEDTRPQEPASTPAAEAGASSAPSPASGESASEELIVIMRDDFFQPRDLSVGSGDLIRVANDDAGPHTFAIETTPVDLEIGPGSSESLPLNGLAAGTYSFYCKDHRSTGMEGTITIL
jgi:plastocyanin